MDAYCEKSELGHRAWDKSQYLEHFDSVWYLKIEAFALKYFKRVTVFLISEAIIQPKSHCCNVDSQSFINFKQSQCHNSTMLFPKLTQKIINLNMHNIHYIGQLLHGHQKNKK